MCCTYINTFVEHHHLEPTCIIHIPALRNFLWHCLEVLKYMYSGANREENCVVFLNIVEHFIRLLEEGRKKCYCWWLKKKFVTWLRQYWYIIKVYKQNTLTCFLKRAKKIFHVFSGSILNETKRLGKLPQTMYCCTYTSNILFIYLTNYTYMVQFRLFWFNALLYFCFLLHET